MKTGLFAPSILPDEGVNAVALEKIHKMLYEEVNGGLSARNLFPAERMSIGKKREPFSIVSVGITIKSTTANYHAPLVAIPTLAGTSTVIAGLSWTIWRVGWISSITTIKIMEVGTTVFSIDVPSPKKYETTIISPPAWDATETVYSGSGYAIPEYMTAITVPKALRLTVVPPAGRIGGVVTVYFITPHIT